MKTRTEQRRIDFEPWPPVGLALPDTIKAIEAGRVEQRELLAEQPDDSRQARIARLLSITGTTTANRLRYTTRPARCLTGNGGNQPEAFEVGN